MLWTAMLLGILSLSLLIFFYQRWMPVLGVKCAPVPEHPLPEGTVILDVRDYQEADRFPVKDAHPLPYPYLKRHIQTIDADRVFVVAPDKVSRNLSIRLLHKNGRIVTGFAVVTGSHTDSPAVHIDCS
ncbi:rhodanese-like domain-containing protein [Salibacterium sp. K-3]